MTTGTSLDVPPSRLQDLIGGLLSIAFGGYVVVESLTYPMGSLFRMGPGFFPAALGALIMGLGLALLLHSFKPRARAQKIEIYFRSLLTIGTAIILFAFLLERVGLAPATLALVLVSTLAEPEWKPLRSVILAVAMTGVVYVLFILLLRMPMAFVTW
jgi:hypothetical protein